MSTANGMPNFQFGDAGQGASQDLLNAIAKQRANLASGQQFATGQAPSAINAAPDMTGTSGSLGPASQSSRVLSGAPANGVSSIASAEPAVANSMPKFMTTPVSQLASDVGGAIKNAAGSAGNAMSGFASQAGSAIKKASPWITPALEIPKIAAVYNDPNSSAGDIASQVFDGAAKTLGGWGGEIGGAAAGTLAAPGAGTIVGGIGGAVAGNMAGGKAASGLRQLAGGNAQSPYDRMMSSSPTANINDPSTPQQIDTENQRVGQMKIDQARQANSDIVNGPSTYVPQFPNKPQQTQIQPPAATPSTGFSNGTFSVIGNSDAPDWRKINNYGPSTSTQTPIQNSYQQAILSNLGGIDSGTGGSFGEQVMRGIHNRNLMARAQDVSGILGGDVKNATEMGGLGVNQQNANTMSGHLGVDQFNAQTNRANVGSEIGSRGINDTIGLGKYGMEANKDAATSPYEGALAAANVADKQAQAAMYSSHAQNFAANANQKDSGRPINQVNREMWNDAGTAARFNNTTQEQEYARALAGISGVRSPSGQAAINGMPGPYQDPAGQGGSGSPLMTMPPAMAAMYNSGPAGAAAVRDRIVRDGKFKPSDFGIQ